MRLLTILGARPQFIKAATLSRAIKEHEGIEEVIVHTGQHFDANMSDIFFKQLDIPRPHHNLHIAGLSHGAMTGRMIEGIETLIQKEQPDWVMVYGDTNSTLAGALAAVKLHVPIAHVESGLRSHDPFMPEEANRVVVDRLSSVLFVPTHNALENLTKEGFPFMSVSADGRSRHQAIHCVGDVMFDALRYYVPKAVKQYPLSNWDLKPESYILCTLHRQENTDNEERMRSVLRALSTLSADHDVVFPVHPRTKSKIVDLVGMTLNPKLRLIEPIGYLEMQALMSGAKCVATDSGGVQKEAYFHRKRCITMRDSTEWVELVEAGVNVLVGTDTDKIVAAVLNSDMDMNGIDDFYGRGFAAEKIIKVLESVDLSETLHKF